MEGIPKEKEEGQRRKPHSINLDLPLDLKKRLAIEATYEEEPVSQLAAFLLYGHSTCWRPEQSAYRVIKPLRIVPSMSAT